MKVVVVFGCFVGLPALIELPKNFIAAAMDKEMGNRASLSPFDENVPY